VRSLVDNGILNGFSVTKLAELPPPQVADDQANLAEDGSVLVDVLDNDEAGATLVGAGTAAGVAGPAHGTVALEGGEIRYTPNANFFGSDSFEYVARNAEGGTATAQVSVQVAPINDAPGMPVLSGSTVSENASPGTVIGQVSASDADGDPIDLSVDDPRFEVNGSGQLVVAAGANLEGDGDRTVPIVITADDGNGGVSTGGASITILDTPTTPGRVQVDIAGSSTASAGSFTVRNTGGLTVNQLSFTIADTMVPDIFFDTDGSGDSGNPTPFTVDSAGGTGVTNASAVMSDPRAAGGHRTLTINLPHFDPGEVFTFHIDVDPGSAKGFGSGSPQGSISGLEMTGTIVTADFDGGPDAIGAIFGRGGALARAVIDATPAPAVAMTLGELENGDSGTVGSPTQTLELEGPAGATVRVIVGNGDVLPDNASGIGLLPPGGLNAIEGVTLITTTLNGSGRGSVQVNLGNQDPNDPNDGVFRIVSSVLDSAGNPAGHVGSPITVRVDATPPPGPVAAFNVGGGAYSSAEDDIVFAADPGPSSGTMTPRSKTAAVGGTQEDPLYLNYGTGVSFGYDVAVPEDGDYAVTLYLAEPFWTAANKRVFDASLEGAVPAAFDDIDVFAEAGGRWQALKLTATTTVTDGVLDLDFAASVNEAVVNAVSVDLV
jgi:hypothetical protein